MPLRRARAAAAAPPDGPPIDVLITVGEFEQRLAPGTSKARAEFLTAAKMVDNARELARDLESTPGLRVSFAEFAGENHGSVVPPAVSRAVRFGLAAGGPPPTAAATTSADRK